MTPTALTQCTTNALDKLGQHPHMIYPMIYISCYPVRSSSITTNVNVSVGSVRVSNALTLWQYITLYLYYRSYKRGTMHITLHKAGRQRLCHMLLDTYQMSKCQKSCHRLCQRLCQMLFVRRCHSLSEGVSEDVAVCQNVSLSEDVSENVIVCQNMCQKMSQFVRMSVCQKMS